MDLIRVANDLSVSKWVNPATGERGLMLWERRSHSSEYDPRGAIGKQSGHRVDVDTLTVTPSIVCYPWHGCLADGVWTDV